MIWHLFLRPIGMFILRLFGIDTDSSADQERLSNVAFVVLIIVSVLAVGVGLAILVFTP